LQTKICTKCGIEKEVVEFSKNKLKTDGFDIYCKCCAKENYRKWYAENTETQKERCTKWYIENIEKKKEINAKWREANPEKGKYNAKYSSAYGIKRRANDHLYRLKINLSSGLANALKKISSSKNGQRSHIIRGCSPEFLKAHIESQFLEGMTWDNFHLWHIDHFIPQASAKNEIELLKLNHWYNLRPLWAEDNLKKRDNAPYTLKFESGIVTIIPFLLIDGLFIRNRMYNYKRNLTIVSESILEEFLNG
jgi:hypothetical protein